MEQAFGELEKERDGLQAQVAGLEEQLAAALQVRV